MRLLIVGGLQGQLGLATKIAMDKGAKVTHATDIEQALASLRGGIGADLVFCDVGLEIGALVRGLAAERICTPVVACGIGTDTRRAVDAIRAGAKEYLPLPAEPELIAAVLAAVADESHQLVYEDEAMAAVLSLADQIAGSEASILVTGESGTGKEVLARYVHRKSARNDKPFVVELSVRLQHGVRVDRECPDDVLHGRQLVAGHQDAETDGLPDLLHELEVRRDAGALVEVKDDHSRIYLGD